MDKLLLAGEEDGFYYLIKSNLEKEYDLLECEFGLQSIKTNARLQMPKYIICTKDNITNPTIFLDIKDAFPNVAMIVICEQTDTSLDASRTRGLLILHRPLNITAIKDAIKKVSLEVDVEIPRKKILMVDDSALILRSLKEMLGSEYDVTCATSGYKALDLMQVNKYDLVLLDYEMPNMNGHELLVEMKKKYSLQNIPVVFLSSVTDATKIKQLVSYKPAGYILKPIDSELIKTTVKKILLGR